MPAQKLLVPTVHSNGTSRKALQDALRSAIYALDNALELLGETAPHGRDYYPQDGAGVHGKVWLAAREQHDARLQAVAQVQRDLGEVYAAIEPALKRDA